jgi:hypothetical protein
MGEHRDTVVGIVVLLLFALFLGASVVRAFGRARERKTRLTRALADIGDRPLFCFCGQPADRPASRTGEPTVFDDMLPWWRKWSLRAKYKPAVPVDGVPTLCNLHGRAWDARLEHKVVEVVQLAQAELHRTIAERMAAYEGGELAQELEATLTSLQKQERKKLQANRSKPGTGQETVVIVSPEAFAPRGIAPDPVLAELPPRPQSPLPHPDTIAPLPPTVKPPFGEYP